MNRAERRRAEREQKHSTPVSPELKSAWSEALHKELVRQQARNEAILAATGPMLESVYAASVILLTEEYGFTQEQCIDFLRKLEDKTLYCIEHQDILDEALEKTGIRIHFESAVDRIEEVT